MSEARLALYGWRGSPYDPVNIVSVVFWKPQWTPLSDSLLNPVKKFRLKLPDPEFDWEGGHVHAWPCAGTQLVFLTKTPLAHFRRELEIHNVRLIDYTYDENRETRRENRRWTTNAKDLKH